MISKSEIKFITSLRQKKYRDQHGLFIAEGPKVVGELLNADFEIHSLFSTDPSTLPFGKTVPVSAKELERISNLKSPNECLAIVHKPKVKPLKETGLIVALDAVRDPGNLGTIIRLCDWFGVSQLWCSDDTADCYNPKVIQATMGSLARVEVLYGDLANMLGESSHHVYGAVMDGNDLYETNLKQNAVLVMGNESNGISETISELLDIKLTIPRYGELQQTESLNVATATAILLAEFRR